MLDMLRALARTDIAPLVRVSANDAGHIGLALDAGADGVVVPMIHTAEQARRAVAACRYPPDGERSFGPARSSLVVPGSPAEVNRAITCVLLIESERGVQAAAEICAVPGVDAVMIGAADLALDLGLDIGDRASELEAAVKAVAVAATQAGVAVMIGAQDAALVGRSARLLLVVASDAGVIRHGVRKQLGAGGGSAPY
jgi:4-hydroxy-2-oxoheptanedioate aldolase